MVKVMHVCSVVIVLRSISHQSAHKLLSKNNWLFQTNARKLWQGVTFVCSWDPNKQKDQASTFLLHSWWERYLPYKFQMVLVAVGDNCFLESWKWLERDFCPSWHMSVVLIASAQTGLGNTTKKLPNLFKPSESETRIHRDCSSPVKCLSTLWSSAYCGISCRKLKENLQEAQS